MTMVISVTNNRLAKRFVQRIISHNFRHWYWCNRIESWRKGVYGNITPNTKAVYCKKNNYWIVADNPSSTELMKQNKE